MTLRRAVLGLGVVALLAGFLLLVLGRFAAGGIQLMILGAVLLLGVLLERGRHRRAAGAGKWQSTSERFVDPTTGRLMQVQYDPASGERRYVDVGPGPGPGPGQTPEAD
jgi:hypothetical protein